MHFFLSTLKIAYVLDTPRPEESGNESVVTTRERQKWDNVIYMCIGHILNGLSDGLFDTNQNEVTAKEQWDKLETRYMIEYAKSKFVILTSLGSLATVFEIVIPSLGYRNTQLTYFDVWNLSLGCDTKLWIS
ncbi:hypothetical protein PVK06_012220 [Gossypium arboreum]|uniref:Zinc finger, CCHC-type n=1 Tax=Gossypium arboreum TaxID=29729 RepID=A0ABR0QBK5_GOSAR|nr:hypothetical protein PVK06_012220 [Gossypium arboreum]